MKRINWDGIRKAVIREVVYRGVPIEEVAQRYGVHERSITRRLKVWGVHLPLHLCRFPRRANWYYHKQRVGHNLPKELRDYNRSDLASLYAMHTQEELARMFCVSRYHVRNALDYHCIKQRTRKEVFDACFGSEARIVS